MPKGVFITGTDTGVGKTTVSAALILALKKRGIKVGAMKPIETGCPRRDGDLLPLDGMLLREAAGMDDPLELVTPVRFEQPLAPLVASALEGRPVDLAALRSAYEVLSGKYGFMVVEGAGGLLVPVSRTVERGTESMGVPSVYFMCDLIKEMRLPVVVVARPALGTLNHTLLTVEHALRAGLRIAGIVINHTSPSRDDPAERTNPSVLSEICQLPFVEVMPYAGASAGAVQCGILPDTVVDLLIRFQ